MRLEPFVDAMRKRLKPPWAVVLGAPQEVYSLIDLLRLDKPLCYQMDLFAADRLRDAVGEWSLAADVVAAADAWDVPGTFAGVVLPAPRGGERSLKIDMVEQAFHLVQPGGTFFVLSPYERDELFPGLLKKIFGAVHASPVKGGTVFWCTRAGERPRRRHEIVYHVRDSSEAPLEIVSRPGVFCYGRLDDGARALVDCLVVEPGERVLELGCGCGAAGIIAGRRNQGKAEVTFVDSNLRATALADINARKNGMTRFTVYSGWRPDVAPRGEVDVVLANPPYFGHGEIAERFIEHARHALQPKGRLYVVTKQTEMLLELLEERFRDVDIQAARGYVVFCAVGQKM
jgi:16S rRNA G1207 methylase RsmC